jgi:hypothetical protein
LAELVRIGAEYRQVGSHFDAGRAERIPYPEKFERGADDLVRSTDFLSALR